MDTPVISVERMRKSDAYTIEHYASSKELMYRAAKGVYDSFDDWKDNSIAIVVGGGNNGGDGYALAGILKREGVESTLIQTSQKLSDDGRYYYDIATELNVPAKQFDDTIDFSEFDILVDCILGTGFIGEVRGTAKEAIDAINSSKAYVISVDINSGMNGDTGEATVAVKSDLTVSIGYLKTGLVTEAAKKYIGRLVNVDIGIVLVDEETTGISYG